MSRLCPPRPEDSCGYPDGVPSGGVDHVLPGELGGAHGVARYERVDHADVLCDRAVRPREASRQRAHRAARRRAARLRAGVGRRSANTSRAAGGNRHPRRRRRRRHRGRRPPPVRTGARPRDGRRRARPSRTATGSRAPRALTGSRRCEHSLPRQPFGWPEVAFCDPTSERLGRRVDEAAAGVAVTGRPAIRCRRRPPR
jgi:hypothetical protein